MKRPLWVLGLSFAAAQIAASVVGLNAALTLAALCLVALLCRLFLPVLRRNGVLLAALLTAAAAFCIWCGAEGLVVRPLARLDGTVQTVRAEVVEAAPESGRCIVRVLEGGIPKGRKLLLRPAYGEDLPAAFSVIEGPVRVYTLDSASWKADGVFLTAVSEGGLSVRPPDTVGLWMRIDAIRSRFTQTIRQWLPGEEGALTAGVCLGDTGGLSEDTVRQFRRTGLSHVLAVSGLHMAVIAQAALALLLALKVPRRFAAGLACGVVVFFMLLTGLTPSVMRAGIMCLVLLAGQMARRQADSLNSLGFALLLLAAVNPYAVLDVGLELSFCATLGLVALAPWMRRQGGRAARRLAAWLTGKPEEEAALPAVLRKLGNSLCVTLSAMLATLPVVALVFRELSIVAPLSNFLAVFPSTVLMVLGCLAMVLDTAPVLGWAVRGLLLFAGGVAKYLLWVVGLLGNWGPAAVSLSEPWVLCWIFGALALLVLGWRLLGLRGVCRAASVSAVALACGLGLHTLLMRGVVTVTSLQADEGLVLLVQRDGRAGAVVSSRETDAFTTLWYGLQERGIRSLDFLLLPDLDGAALGDLPYFADRCPVDTLIYPKEGEGLLQAEAAACGSRQRVDAAARFTFWGSGFLELQGGWARLQLGETRVLLCPPEGDAAALPEGWRDTHLAVFAGTPPWNVTALRAVGGVLSCAEEQVAYVTKALPWGVYPISLTAEGDVAVMTRGLGDLTMRQTT